MDTFAADLDRAIALLGQCYQSQHKMLATPESIDVALRDWGVSRRVSENLNVSLASKSIVDVDSEVEYNSHAVSTLCNNIIHLLDTADTKGIMTLPAGRMCSSVVLIEALHRIYHSGITFVYVIEHPDLLAEMTMHHTSFEIVSLRDYAITGSPESVVLYESTGAIDFGPSIMTVRLVR